MYQYGPLTEWYWQGKTEELKDKPGPGQLSPSQISHWLVWDWTQAPTVTVQQLIAWAIAQPTASRTDGFKTYLIVGIQNHSTLVISVALTVCATSSHSTDHHSLDATVVIAPSCPTMYCFSLCSNGNLRLSSASFLNCNSLNYKHKNSHGRTLRQKATS
jgi:hypothetical protein